MQNSISLPPTSPISGYTQPGTQLSYKGSAIPEGEKNRVERRVVSTVTDLSKWIDGVRTLVIWERDYTAGKLGESEIAFFAQDKAGNVWLLGEYPEEYENRKVVDAPTLDPAAKKVPMRG